MPSEETGNRYDREVCGDLRQRQPQRHDEPAVEAYVKLGKLGRPKMIEGVAVLAARDSLERNRV